MNSKLFLEYYIFLLTNMNYKTALFLAILVLILSVIAVGLLRRKESYHASPIYNFVVAAPFKNEAHILKEWIEHYRLHNIDHLYLMNDGSNDNFEEILEPYIKEGYVTLLHQTEVINTYPRQKVVYQRLLTKHLPSSKWWAILDLDEFLYCPDEVDLQKVMKKYDERPEVSQVYAHWLMFGSSGHIEQPKLVVPNFLMRRKEMEAQVKSIFRADRLKDFDVHFHKVDGESVHDWSFIINHYAIQSWKFFERVKMTRGDVNLYVQQVGIVRDRAYFDKYDYNEVEDTRLSIQNKSLRS